MQKHEWYPPEYPCQMDYTNTFQCIQRFRDIMNMGSLLYEDVDTEILNHKAKLREAGWSEEYIQNLQSWAMSSTILEDQLPRTIKTIRNHK